jgi:signal peptidase I
MRKIRKTWNKYTEGWFGTIIYLFLGFVIAYGVNITLGLILGTETPVVAVFSDSMVPTFYKGDMIIVYGEKDIKIGDVIVFDVPDKKYPIIHRIYKMNDGMITTKGDNNSGPDTWSLKKEDIYGKAILKIPILGWVKIKFVEITGFG